MNLVTTYTKMLSKAVEQGDEEKVKEAEEKMREAEEKMREAEQEVEKAEKEVRKTVWLRQMVYRI